MKVNLVVNSFPTPSETFLFNLVVGLESKGVDVTVIASAPTAYNNFYKSRLQEWSGKIKYVPGKKVTDLIKLIFIFLKHIKLFSELNRVVGFKKAMGLCALYNAIMHNQPDIVHFSFSGIAIQYHHILSYLNKHCKTVVSCRGTGEKVKPIVDRKRGQGLRSIFTIVDSIHCVSSDMVKTISPYLSSYDKVFVNFPSIMDDKFMFNCRPYKLNTETFQIVTTGRLYYQKGYVFALEALFKLKQAGYRFHYHILGEGPDREMLEFVIHEMGLQDYVYLHGRVNGEVVYEYLNKSDVFLLSSMYEGIANAALEAMSVGIPIVSTTAGGMVEVITEGINGKLVPTYDSQAIYEALKWTINNYDKSIEMAIKARETIENNHTHKQQIDVFLNQYMILIK